MASNAINSDRLSVLGEALQEAIAGRRVRAAVFSTFSFDPGFFELRILPNLFTEHFHQVDKMRRIQLEDALQSTREICVYYDAQGISADATPAHLDVSRIALHRRTGCFHPKLVLVLVENEIEDDWGVVNEIDPPLSLIVGTLSANLTRAGWWENVETGYFEELQDRDINNERCSFRGDLRGVLKQLKSFTNPDETHTALDMITEFVRQRVTKRAPVRRMHDGQYFTRLYHGQRPLPEWLVEAGLTRFDWNLEIISPYFDASDARVLQALVDALEPLETRIFLPCDQSGDALVTSAFRDSVAELATWSDLPADLQNRGGAKLKAEAATRRRVHAKVYRFWSHDGREVVLTGSVNLTSAAHSASRSGNYEAAFLVDMSHAPGRRKWWLHPLDHKPPCADVVADEREDCTPVFVNIHLRYDWSREAFEYRVDDEVEGTIEIRTVAGVAICEIPSPRFGTWLAISDDVAGEIRELLSSTSFVAICHPKGIWRVLIREEGMHRRPSLLQHLSPEEILMYWSLLSGEQRATFIEHRLEDAGTLEGLAVSYKPLHTANTIFDRVAGVFHAFERQYRHISESIANGHTREARSILFGSKYDSLPVLLTKIAEDHARDPIMSYLTFLSAKQLLSRIETEHPDFTQSCDDDRPYLVSCFNQLSDLRDTLLTTDEEREPFLEWYEELFGGIVEIEEGAHA